MALSELICANTCPHFHGNAEGGGAARTSGGFCRCACERGARRNGQMVVGIGDRLACGSVQTATVSMLAAWTNGEE